MKTAEEIYNKYWLNKDCYECGKPDEDSILKAMEEYADQFKPKWIPVHPSHELYSGTHVFLLKSGNTITIEVRPDEKEYSDTLSRVTHYFKYDLPEKPQENG